MAPIDDEIAIRAVLTELTGDQPPPPPNRYAVVRRRAAVRRRRQLAGAAAAVAALVAVAIAIPLGLVRIGAPAPEAPRPYHVSDRWPGKGASPSLVGYGTLTGKPWKMFVDRQPGNVWCWSPSAAAQTGDCTNWPPAGDSRTGAPATVATFTGMAGGQVDIGYVRSDVTVLRVDYGNGQVLTVRPVAVFGHQYASWFAIPTPYPAAVTRITAYARSGEVGFAVPFSGGGMVSTERWLRPGQAALPAPASALLGSGHVDGRAWRDKVYVGPWGTCFVGVGSYFCFPVTSWTPKPGRLVHEDSTAFVQSTFGVVSNNVSAQVSYLLLTTGHGQVTRARAVAADGSRFCAYATQSSDPFVTWAAYSASGQLLGTGHLSS